MPETGIGRWSEAAFRRAMRSGVNRDGQHLYPTFPYDHFTNVTDEDDRALYAFLMTRQPVRAPARENQLSFPLNQRLAIAGWKLLFLRRDTYQPDPSKSAEWNRGAYLVEGLAHCGACHTPRNALGAERDSAQFAGGDVDNWHAYAINDQSPRRCRGMRMRCLPICATAGTPITAPRAGRWRKWSAICLRSPTSDVRAIAVYMAERVRRAGAGSQAPGRGGAGAGRIRRAAAAPHGPTRPVRRSTPRPARHAMRAAGRCPMAGSISLSAPRSAAPIRATSPTSCCRASARWKANAARSCRALPPA